ncbi:MAG: hypothetical protein R3224_04460 [Balneolaceae bacterium]|nr:hypothetical protein [Balneolaceae bacterium]
MTVFAVAMTVPAQAQQRVVEKTLAAEPGKRVELNLKYGETIVVRGWDRNEVSFRALVEINEGRLNDAFIAEFADDSQSLWIDTDFDRAKLREGRSDECPCPRSATFTWSDKGMICSTIRYEIFMPRGAKLALETVSADVELTGLTGPVHAKSISGFVDLSWPERRGAGVTIKTVTGEAYTDLENIRFTNRRAPMPHVGYELRGAIGTGGPAVRLESVSGDLFLRKSGENI